MVWNLTKVGPLFFFLISNKDKYSITLSYAKKHKAERTIQIEQNKKREKRKGKDIKCKGES